MALIGEIVKDYLSKFPNSATRTLAGLIYKENKSVFKTYDHAREAIKYYRGASGSDARARLKDKSFMGQGRDGAFKELPKGLVTLDDWGLFKINGDHKTLLLSDAHIPYHAKRELEIAVKKGLDFNVDLIILNGDWADHYSISRWQNDPRQRNFKNERDMVLLSFEWLRDLFPKARIIYKLGNHEERYENYMELKAPELLGIDSFSFENVFELKNYGIELVKDMKPIKLNELIIIHGHEYRFSISNPVNPARGLFLRAKANAICGHFHQPSSHSENNIEDKFTSTWSTGHLGDPHPKYLPLNKWSHGFAIIESSGSKFFQVNNYKIIDGETYRA